MPTLAQRLSDFRATDTCLTCASGIHSNKHAPSIFRFVRDHVQELSPASIVNRLAHSSASKPLDVQIFSSNQAILINKSARQFVMKIFALCFDMRVYTLKQKHRLPSAVRAFLSTRYTSLRDPQRSFGFSIVSRIIDYFTRAQRGERSQANVNADCVRVERQWLRFNLANKHGKPAASLAFDRQSLDCPFDRTRQLNSHFTNLRDAQGVCGKDILQLFIKGHGVIPPKRLKSRITRLATSTHAPKEPLKCSINPRKHLSQNMAVESGNVGAQFTNFRQLINLIEMADVVSINPPSITPLLDCCVVQLTAKTEMIFKDLNLSLAGINAVLKRLNHCSSISRVRSVK